MKYEAEIASIEYEIYFNGECAASYTDYDDALHYAMIYSQDGEITMCEVTRRIIKIGDDE